jgi:hypothetical protein
MQFQGYGFNTDANQYRCVLTAAEELGSGSSWTQASEYTTAQSLQHGLQQIECSIGALVGRGEGTLSLKLQCVPSISALLKCAA